MRSCQTATQMTAFDHDLLSAKLSCALGDMHLPCPGQDEWTSWHSSGDVRGTMATGGTGLGCNGVGRRNALIHVVFVWASVMLGGAQVLGSLQRGAPRATMLAGTVSSLASIRVLHFKSCFQCRAPVSMTRRSAMSMRMMRRLSPCPRHGT
jgi:hypothetical protein